MGFIMQDIYPRKFEASFYRLSSKTIKDYFALKGIKDSKFNYSPVYLGDTLLVLPEPKNIHKKFDLVNDIDMLVEYVAILSYMNGNDIFNELGQYDFDFRIISYVFKILMRYNNKSKYKTFSYDMNVNTLMEKVYENINIRLENPQKFAQDIKDRCKMNTSNKRMKKEVHGNTKVTKEQIELIKQWSKEGMSYRKIADEFNSWFNNESIPENERVSISHMGVKKILKKY